MIVANMICCSRYDFKVAGMISKLHVHPYLIKAELVYLCSFSIIHGHIQLDGEGKSNTLLFVLVLTCELKCHIQ